MAENKYVLYNNAIVHIDVRNSFLELKTFLGNTYGFSIDIVESVKTEYEITLELFERYKYKKDLRVQRIESESDERYQIVKTAIQNGDPTLFEPPIESAVYANVAPFNPIYPIPNYPMYDPRRSGRIIKIGPTVAINPTVLSFLVQNAGVYGFIHYGPEDPTIWYWRGDLEPYTYTPAQTVTLYSTELSFLL